MLDAIKTSYQKSHSIRQYISQRREAVSIRAKVNVFLFLLLTQKMGLRRVAFRYTYEGRSFEVEM